ncbi:MAG: hypothetical protein WC781_03800 [Candidatus Pacearchaeota archaeon]|jgi:hypothetical protein
MKQIICLLVLALLIIPLANADTIDPGTKPIQVNNIITNINDFPDYTFISISYMPGMCPLSIIESDGKIPPVYKFCGTSIYAIENSKFNQEIILSLYNENITNITTPYDYLSSIGAKKVIQDIRFYESALISSPVIGINNYYTIKNLNQTLSKPDIVKKSYNLWLYIYILIPIITIIAITIVIIKKRRK